MGALKAMKWADIYDPDAVYPADVLQGQRDALVLFCGGFMGKQDAYYVAQAHMNATCVDVRGEYLAPMRDLYPPEWQWLEDDVYRLVPELVAAGEQWDVVSVDCPSGHFAQCRKLIPQFCALARNVVILGTSFDERPRWNKLPEGWRAAALIERSSFRGGVYWAVLTK